MNATWQPPRPQRLAHARQQALRIWNEAPPWVRSWGAVAGTVGIMVIGLLLSLAMVVQGVVERSEQLHQAQAEQRKAHDATLMTRAQMGNASPGVDRVGASLAQFR